MKVVIATDMEGAAGIDRVEQCFRGYPEAFETGRQQLIADINACIRGLRRGGAKDIKVVEGHAWGDFHAFESGDLDGRPEVLRGRGGREPMVSWAEKAVFVGYHAMAGTPDGFLSHTTMGSVALSAGGEPVGEMVMTAATCGSAGVPVLLVTGDHATVREARHFLPWAVGVEVKRATSISAVRLLSREEASRAIETGAAAAMARAHDCRPLRLPEPLEIEVQFRATEFADASMILPMARRQGDRAIGFTAPTFAEGMRFFASAVQLTTQARQRPLWSKLQTLPEVQQMSHEWLESFLRPWLEQPSPFTPNAKALREA